MPMAAPRNSARSVAMAAASAASQRPIRIRRVVLARDRLGQRQARRDAELRRERLDEDRHQVRDDEHPQEHVAELRAGLDVGREVARVHVGDAGDERRAEERQHALDPLPRGADARCRGDRGANGVRRHAVISTPMRSASSTPTACRVPSTSRVSGAAEGSLLDHRERRVGHEPQPCEVAQERADRRRGPGAPRPPGRARARPCAGPAPPRSRGRVWGSGRRGGRSPGSRARGRSRPRAPRRGRARAARPRSGRDPTRGPGSVSDRPRAAGGGGRPRAPPSRPAGVSVTPW